jgi:hypothetical protein
VKRTTVKLPDELDGRLRHEAERREMRLLGNRLITRQPDPRRASAKRE